MTNSLGGEDLGIVLNESVKESSNGIIPFALYGTDSSDNDVFDFGGATKMITVECVKVDATEANLLTHLQTLEAMINGNQETTVDYVSDFRGTLKVKIMDIDSTKTSPSEVRYIIRMVQSK